MSNWVFNPFTGNFDQIAAAGPTGPTGPSGGPTGPTGATGAVGPTDRKSTRLNSSHIPLSRMPSSA